MAAMHPDHFLGSLEPHWASLEKGIYGGIFFTIESELLGYTLNRTVRVSFVLSVLGILLGLNIFPVKVAFAEPLNDEGWLKSLFFIDVGESDDASDGSIRACT